MIRMMKLVVQARPLIRARAAEDTLGIGPLYRNGIILWTGQYVWSADFPPPEEAIWTILELEIMKSVRAMGTVPATWEAWVEDASYSPA